MRIIMGFNNMKIIQQIKRLFNNLLTKFNYNAAVKKISLKNNSTNIIYQGFKANNTQDSNTDESFSGTDESSSPPAPTRYQKFPIGVKRKHDKDRNEVKSVHSTDNSDDDDEQQTMGIGSMSNHSMGGTTKPSDFIEKSTFGAKMMRGMGWKEGVGLGAKGQGRLEPVSASNQQGRRGLGLQKSDMGIVEPEVVWFDGADGASAEEDVNVEWVKLSDREESVLTEEDMKNWLKLGPSKTTLEGETRYCRPKVLMDVLQCKTVFDALDNQVLLDARTRSNPYETIKSGIFMNRAAMKMANMDCITDFLFTNCVPTNELLYFADICAGPGGFTEYMLWRRAISSRGFGFTLRGSCDFKEADILAGPGEAFTPYYGPDDTGDIFKKENLQAFRQYILQRTDGRGVHIVMADGGFSVKGEENIQEIRSKQLYLCQFLCAINILAEGGSFVCKLFDIFTDFSVGLIYLISKVFRDFSIIKPVTSRPANSERYIVCRSLIKSEELDLLQDHLYYVNDLLNSITSKSAVDDVIELVPFEVLEDDTIFFDHIFDTNNIYGKAQALGLAKIRAYADDKNLLEIRQCKVREDCLKKWNVSDIKRIPTKPKPYWADIPITRIFGQYEHKSLNKPNESCLRKVEVPTKDTLLKDSFVIANYSAVLVGNNGPMLFYSKGGQHVLFYNGKTWEDPSTLSVGFHLKLPAATIIWAAFTHEFCPPKGMRKLYTLHILDILFLYGKDLRGLHYTERLRQIRKLIQLINTPESEGNCLLRCPEPFELADLESQCESLTMLTSKANRNPLPMVINKEDNKFFNPTNVVITKVVSDPWIIAYSRSSKRNYYYNFLTKESLFDMPDTALAPFSKCDTMVIPMRKIYERASSDKFDHKQLIEVINQRLGKH